jgi:hypothetical protein
MVHTEIAWLAKIVDCRVLFNTISTVIRNLLYNFHYVKSSLSKKSNTEQDLASVIYVEVNRILLK